MWIVQPKLQLWETALDGEKQCDSISTFVPFNLEARLLVCSAGAPFECTTFPTGVIASPGMSNFASNSLQRLRIAAVGMIGQKSLRTR